MERQRIRAKKQKSAKNDLHDLIDNDLEREMEAIHLILVENLDLLNQWKNAVASNEPLPEGARPLPPVLDGSLLEENLQKAHREALLGTLDSILKITYAIETVHCNAIEKFHKTVRTQGKVDERIEFRCKKSAAAARRRVPSGTTGTSC